MGWSSNARRWRWSLVALSGLIAAMGLMVLAAILTARETRKKAERCLQAVLNLELGQGKFEEAQRLKNEFGGIDNTPGANRCTPKSCNLIFPFDNRWLHWLHLAPLTEFVVGLGVRDGHVIGRGLGYISYAEGGGWYSVEESLARPAKKNFDIHVFPDAKGLPAKVLVDFTTAASPGERQLAYAINLECLSKLRECKDARKVLGPVWQRAEKELANYPAFRGN